MKQKERLQQTLYRFWASKWRDGELWLLGELVDRFRNHSTLRRYNLVEAEKVLTKVMYHVRRMFRANGGVTNVLVARGKKNKIIAYKKGDPGSLEDVELFIEEVKFQMKNILDRVEVYETTKESGKKTNLLPSKEEEQLFLDLPK